MTRKTPEVRSNKRFKFIVFVTLVTGFVFVIVIIANDCCCCHCHCHILVKWIVLVFYPLLTCKSCQHKWPDHKECHCHWITFAILAMFKWSQGHSTFEIRGREANRRIFGTHHKLNPVEQGCGTVFKLQIKYHSTKLKSDGLISENSFAAFATSCRACRILKNPIISFIQEIESAKGNTTFYLTIHLWFSSGYGLKAPGQCLR